MTVSVEFYRSYPYYNALCAGKFLARNQSKYPPRKLITDPLTGTCCLCVPIANTGYFPCYGNCRFVSVFFSSEVVDIGPGSSGIYNPGEPCSVLAQCWGAGGAGGSNGDGTNAGQGGGGGGYAEFVFQMCATGTANTLHWSVGIGGTSNNGSGINTNGQPGGDTTVVGGSGVSGACIGYGGGGGTGYGGTGGPGGGGLGGGGAGTVTMTGQNGANPSGGNGGRGGDSAYFLGTATNGYGGNGGTPTFSPGDGLSNGQFGSNYGGGGGGAGSPGNGNDGDGFGGYGANGAVRLTKILYHWGVDGSYGGCQHSCTDCGAWHNDDIVAAYGNPRGSGDELLIPCLDSHY